ncbi:N-acetyldiaminopimelate deacetylase [Lacticaseibacillus saniviri]|uniref:N-acetyldiaminopimelate deacetylase n=1 Tax=Lacticaseibacillus saniviri JCM 17471 = DSM 24301 TaxID=1293598 RepID=A0A0R2MSD8_9LACO|nr:N-acetyldiaminopimelate deacetylase [Lacticaseibacillus saniviri]KRO16470.1 peptidase, m20 m25 m40 family protein [Lacticaseibacillus saniviri JCM 17471 = DSM 24301]MCG4282006.1 N-acetyldiaminopimelate deacetylase [Lacticaseibacillus saniviri]
MIDLIQTRRDLHQIPELALNETETHDYLLQVIAQLPQTWLTVRTIKVLPTAILVHITGSQPTQTLGYRADMDALPVDETTELPFSSTHAGISHACGHDLHMTVALGILAHFATHQPKDNLIFFFQPAEESHSGGKIAYDADVFTGDWHIDELYGLHDRPNLPAGTIATRIGTLFAGTSEITIDFTGRTGHAAFPQAANDMVVAASAFVTQLQSIVARNIAPTASAVITIGKFEAGTIRNVIAGAAHLEGTLRGFTQEDIAYLKQRIQELASGIAKSYNCDVHVTLEQGGYYPVVNDAAITQDFITYMQTAPVDFERTEPVMTGEDFGYLLHHIPGTMFWLGVGDTTELHTSTFNPDEHALQPAVNAMIGYLTHRMQKGSRS